MKKSELLMDVFCVFFLLTLPLRSSLVSVVFDFNDSLNDVVPVSPMLQAIEKKKKRNDMSKLLMDVFCVSCFFCLHHSDRVQ